MKRRYLAILALATLVWASGCRGTKKLASGEQLYNASNINFLNPKEVNDRKLTKSMMLEKAKPRPNSKFLGLFRIRLWMYNKVKEPKKQKGFKYWLKHKIGEEPVLYNEEDSKRTVMYMQKYLEDNGYFRSKITYDTTVKRREVTVTYSVLTEGQYFIGNIYLPRDTDMASRIIASNFLHMIVRSKQPYNVDNLKAERDKYANLIRDKGFYDFNKEYIYYYVDTTIGDHKADIYFLVKPPTDTSGHTLYYLDTITAYPAYSIDDTAAMHHADTTEYKGIRIIKSETFLRKNPLTSAILLKQGDPFSTQKHSYTVNHLLDLGIYKFVNIKYVKTGRDSLQPYIYLTPGNTQDIVAELNATTTTTNFLGVGASFSYVNRNIFKGAENLSISASTSVETQLGQKQTFINTLDVSGKVELGFPRFITPFKMKRISLFYVPRTKFALSDNFEKRIQYYTINSFGYDMGYDWRETAQKRHILTPLSINSIRLFSTTTDFDNILAQNPNLKASFQDIFIIGLNYSFIYNGKKADFQRNYFYFRGNIDLAGNVSYLIAKAASPNHVGAYKIFGRPFANYSKFDVDGRYYHNFTKKHSFVARILAGVALPYGNSTVMPYLKQFFVGGSTSIRAYRLRTLGPGSYSKPTDTENTVFPDQTGDIKLEMNAEYRFTIVKFLKGAFFLDAGNVWLAKKDTSRPNGEFDPSRFYKEIALGTGIGIRLDFNFFVIRLDMAFPLRRPELPENDRWVIKDINPLSKDWRKNNLVWNIAIGYPF